VKTQEYYSQIVTRGRRGTPTYAEAERDLKAVMRTQLVGYATGF
jgi:hypothetical protein